MKILTVIGARPQFIKAATLSHAIARYNAGRLPSESVLREIMVHTGQHYDYNMSEVFFRELEIPRPDFNLGIGGASHGAMTGRMLEKIEKLIIQETPEVVLVYGDTNTTLAGALAAVKLQVPVAHVEAGLRSFNFKMPEEINRRLTDHVSQFLFAPTETAVHNLRHEGIQASRIHLVGDVMYTAALFYGDKAEQHSQILAELNLLPQSYLLATIHRAENTDELDRLNSILEGLGEVDEAIRVVMPIHPRTRKVLKQKVVSPKIYDRLQLIDPVGYLDMLMLEKNARLIATDSGGVQKEAFFFRVPCVTLRDETEWVELVELGWNRLVPPTSAAAVASGILQALASSPRGEGQPYGDGKAAERIVHILLTGLS